MPRYDFQGPPDAAVAATCDVIANADFNPDRSPWVPACPSRPSRWTLFSQRYQPLLRCRAPTLLVIHDYPSDLSPQRAVAPHKLRMSRFKGYATAGHLDSVLDRIEVPVQGAGEAHDGRQVGFDRVVDQRAQPGLAADRVLRIGARVPKQSRAVYKGRRAGSTAPTSGRSCFIGSSISTISSSSSA